MKYIDKIKMNTITNVCKVGNTKKTTIKTSNGYSIKEKITLNKLKKNLNGNMCNSRNKNNYNVIRPLKSLEKLKMGKSQKKIAP